MFYINPTLSPAGSKTKSILPLIEDKKLSKDDSPLHVMVRDSKGSISTTNQYHIQAHRRRRDQGDTFEGLSNRTIENMREDTLQLEGSSGGNINNNYFKQVPSQNSRERHFMHSQYYSGGRTTPIQRLNKIKRSPKISYPTDNRNNYLGTVSNKETPLPHIDIKSPKIRRKSKIMIGQHTDFLFNKQLIKNTEYLNKRFPDRRDLVKGFRSRKREKTPNKVTIKDLHKILS